METVNDIEALVAFVAARVAEDEASARWVLDYSGELAEMGRWEEWVPARHVNNVEPPYYDYRAVMTKLGGLKQHEVVRTYEFTDTKVSHIARFGSPARVQREVAARRALVAEVTSWGHLDVDEGGEHSCATVTVVDTLQGSCNCGLAARQRRMLAPIAAVWAEHPDYRAEWAA